jgi:hypothetical protein
MARTMEDEIEDSFAENPQLAEMTLKGIARFFIVQGEIRYSSLQKILEYKANYYRCRLWDLDKEFCKKMDKEFKDTVKLQDFDD